MRNTYNFLCMTHQMYCSSWSELYPTFADLFQRTFITKRGKIWNESLIISIESSFLWVKAIASFEDRRDQNANTNTMWKLTSSSGQSRILSEAWWTFQMLGKAFQLWQRQRFPEATAVSDETLKSWSCHKQLYQDNCMVSGSFWCLYPNCSSYSV